MLNYVFLITFYLDFEKIYLDFEKINLKSHIQHQFFKKLMLNVFTTSILKKLEYHFFIQ